MVGIMHAKDEDGAWGLVQELDDMRIVLADEHETEAAEFLSILQGVYKKAFDRICGTVEGGDWKLVEEGKPPPTEPEFATWEEVRSESARQQTETKKQQFNGVAARTHYVTLGVAQDATQAAIKAAFRSLALKWHPDVNQDPQANQRFLDISAAYDVLSDAESRRLYDLYGEGGMQKHAGAGAGRGNSSRFWDEFTPYKRENKSTRARDASREAFGGPDSSSAANSTQEQRASVAKVGDVVEYPLSEAVRRQHGDGRLRGVALLVGRNMDRGDAKKLPLEALDLCELEPLRQESRGSQRWVSDELEPPTFARLAELQVVPVAHFDHRFDKWLILTELSPTCGGPDLPDEIMV